MNIFSRLQGMIASAGLLFALSATAGFADTSRCTFSDTYGVVQTQNSTAACSMFQHAGLQQVESTGATGRLCTVTFSVGSMDIRPNYDRLSFGQAYTACQYWFEAGYQVDMAAGLAIYP